MVHFSIGAVFTVLLSSLVFNVKAQGCCGIGSSLVAGGYPVLEQGTFFLAAEGGYSQTDSALYSKSAATVNLAYGITSRLSLSIKSSYAWLHLTTRSMGGSYSSNNNGLADGFVGAQYALIRMNPMNKQELNVGADVGIPWGVHDKVQNSVLLAPNMQSGSGGYSTGGFISFNKAFPAYKLSGAAVIAGRIKFENQRKDNPGNEASFLISGTAGPWLMFKGSLALNYKLSQATRDVFGTEAPSTKGSRLDALPSMECSFTEKIKMTCEAELSLWRDVYQKKYGNNFGVRSSILFFVPLFGD